MPAAFNTSVYLISTECQAVADQVHGLRFKYSCAPEVRDFRRRCKKLTRLAADYHGQQASNSLNRACSRAAEPAGRDGVLCKGRENRLELQTDSFDSRTRTRLADGLL